MHTSSKKTSHAPKLGLFTLAMINVAAVCSIRNWPVIAEYGSMSLFFFLAAALCFFVPVALVSAELATGWPHSGGIFAWVKEAFGHRTGFLAIWLLWVENVVWYPTILSFIAATIAYLFKPELATNGLYTACAILGIFWGITLLNFLGLRVSALISTWGVILGTFIPGSLIIFLGIKWYLSGAPVQISFTASSLLPHLSSFKELVFFTSVCLCLAGMEMSAVHAREVQNPQKRYPRAIFLSGAVIILLSILGVLSIALVVPQSQISFVAGSLQAISYLFAAYNLSWATPYFALLIAIGALGSMSAWIAGPSKGLLAAAENGDLPPWCARLNEKKAPARLLCAQGVIVSLLSLMFAFMPTVNSAFWILNVLVTQVYLVMYVLMFAAAIKLRYKRPQVERAYQVPGSGNKGMWLIGGMGAMVSLFVMGIGFVPSEQVPLGMQKFYVGFLAIGMLATCLAPSAILLFKKPSWERKNALRIEEDG